MRIRSALARADSAVCSTLMNEHSSRSHLIFTVNVTRRIKNEDGGRQPFSRLCIVDLAGNERDAMRSVGGGLAERELARCEGTDINKSLSALNQCLQSMASAGKGGGGGGPIPSFRDSTLTRLLESSLKGAKIFVIACVSALSTLSGASDQTLRYADQVKAIKTGAEGNAMLLESSLDNHPVKFIHYEVFAQHGKIPRSSDNLCIFLHEASFFQHLIFAAPALSCVLS